MHFKASALLLVLTLGMGVVAAQEPSRPSGGNFFPRNYYRGGEDTLRAFAPVSAATRASVVKFNVDNMPVALGTVVDSSGLVLSKASELKTGKLTCWTAEGKEVPGQVVATDEQLDLVLIRVKAKGLKPVRWAEQSPSIGQWAISPGVTETPHAVGIVSANTRQIRAERPYLGVQFESSGSSLLIEEVLSGMGGEKAGIQAGDILRSVNGERMSSRAQVVEKLRTFREGQVVRVGIEREGSPLDFEVVLMPATAEEGTGRMRRLRGATSQRVSGFEQVIEHDTVLQPWLCGGPLVDIDGRAIGMNIARASRVSSYALPAGLVQQALQKLTAAAATVQR